MSWEKMVNKPNGDYVKLKVGHGNKIYLDGNETGYKVGGDGKIYTNSGSFVSKIAVENFLRSQGLIKWFSSATKKLAIPGEFLLFNNFLIIHS